MQVDIVGVIVLEALIILDFHKMVEIELFNNSKNESYKITAKGSGVGFVTIKGEYWNFK